MQNTLNELAQAWHFFGNARYVEAERLAASVLARFPDNVSALALHAAAAWQCGMPIEPSLDELRRAVELAPDNGAIRHNLATLLASNGDLEGSSKQFRHALALKPTDTQAFFGLALNMKFRETEALIDAMVGLHDSGGVSGIDRELLTFALAKVFDDLGEPERSMRYALEANAAISRPFDLKGEAGNLQDLKRMTAADAFRHLPAAVPSAKTPLYIVGMNRSGTTLVESILSRHPQVLAQGEINDMYQLEQRVQGRLVAEGRKIGRNAMVPLLPLQWLDARATDLTKKTESRATGPYSVAIDKLPDNALRLGLISRLFPNARIVHVRRHPLDTGLSNFMRRFTSGQGFSFRMDWIGAKIRMIADSMALWKQALDIPILDLSYERLVNDPETESRRLVAFAGLEWDESCLTPAKTQRSVLTASQWQVRQPIYTGSIGRWRLYGRWLGPMIDAMGGMDWVEQEFADQASRASRSVKSSK